MNTSIHTAGWILSLGLAFNAGAHAAAANETATKAAESCEAAVAETIKEMRGRQAQDVQFIESRRALRPTTGEDTEVKGAGQYHGTGNGAMPFTYSCAFNAESGSTSGIVFRDAARAAPTEPAWQPDLASVSPEACETAIAATLKDKYPRVGRIAFGSDSRQLRPAPAGRSSLEGQGAVQRAPGMSLMPFKYRCEFEPGSGRIVAAQAD